MVVLISILIPILFEEGQIEIKPHSNIPVFHSSGSPGFSRPEFLILLGVALTVLSIVLPARAAYQRRQKLNRVKTDFTAIVRGMDRYFNEHRNWPSRHMGTPNDVRYGDDLPNREIMDVLRAEERSVQQGAELNRSGIVFLNVPEAGQENSPLSPEGDYLDPWRTPYQIVVDTDLDEHCFVANSIYGLQVNQDLLIWSCGPDRASGTSDDILGWRRQTPGVR